MRILRNSCILVLFICLSYAEEQKTPKIYSLHIQSDIKYRFSTTLVTSKVANPDTVSREARFDVTLPNEAFITKFKLIINNVTYDGEVKEKEEAKKQYEAAKNRGQSAGHIVAKPRETNKFQIMVNVAAQEKVIFELTYQELLRRTKKHYSHVTYIDPGQLVNDFLVEVTINESRDLSMLKVPAIRNDILTDDNNEDDNKIAVIERPSSKSAKVTYRPTVDQQRQESEMGVRGQFVVEYDIERENIAGELLVVSGYFVHYFAPDSLPPLPMDIVFILDKSGSMSGRKIVQLKEAMSKILSDMRTDDRFTIMTFDGSLSFWKNTLVSVTDQTLLEAKDFVQKIQARGSTNINDALKRGIELLSGVVESSRAPVIIFLTDGEPTTGVTNPSQILSNVRSKNEIEVPIFSLAFGRGADYQFTKKLAAQNNGLGRKIYEDSDSSLQITGFIEEISTVLLKNVTFKYLNDNVNQTTLTKTSFNTVFGGSELIVSGRLTDQTSQSLTTNSLPLKITGTGRDEPFICIYPPLPIVIEGNKTTPNDKSTSGYFSQITEKLWAYLTIKQMLRKKDALTDEAEKQKSNDKILQMSLKYKFVTPLTSMVVTMPDELKATPRLVEDDVVSSDRGQIQNANFGTISSAGMSGVNHRVAYFMPPRLPQLHRGILRPLSYPSLLPRRRYSSPILNVPVLNKAIVLARSQTTTSVMQTTTLKPSKPVQQPRRSTKSRFVSFLVKIQGLSSPLCMNLDMKPGNFTFMRILTRGIVGEEIMVQIGPTRRRVSPLVRVIHKKQTKVQNLVPIPALGNEAQLLQINNDDVEMTVTQSIEKSSNRFQLYSHIPVTSSDDFDGILGFFKGMKGKIMKQLTRKGKLVGKLKLMKKGSKRIKVRAVELKSPAPNVNTCWFLNKNSIKRLNMNLLQFQS